VPHARRFGLSTQLYHAQRLTSEHLRQIGGAGFETVELMATRTHLDYHNEAVIADLQGWLSSARLDLESVHAPTSESFVAGRHGAVLNLASPDAAAREHAVDEALRALHIARRLPFRTLVVHAGAASTPRPAPGTNSRDAARRSIERLAEAARPLGVTVGVELVPNELSTSGSLVHFVEEVLEAGAATICLDLGHARLEGDVADAIENVAGHIGLVHAHDNRGRQDDHLLPFEGTIDWPWALTTLQKVGYDGAVILEPSPQGSTRDTLARARAARARMEQLLEAY